MFEFIKKISVLAAFLLVTANASAQVNAPSEFTLGQDGITILSLCSSSSSNLVQSQYNTMAGLVGVTVPTDRTVNPSAFYVIPSEPNESLEGKGLQWYDMVSTSVKSWRGSTELLTPETQNEYGHRIVIPCAGTYPVTAYTVTIMSTLNEIPGSTFRPWMSSDNKEIPFNRNYVGINWGANGKVDSVPNPITGLFDQKGDDTVYQNGQLPSTVTYHVWYRFGATVRINADGPNGMASVRNQFARGPMKLRAHLLRDNVVVAKKEVVAAQAVLKISLYGNGRSVVGIQGGQENSVYTLEHKPLISQGNWSPFMVGTTLTSGGGGVDFPSNTERMGFLRARLN